MPDNRYTVGLEWCGYRRRMLVVRFCGAWVGKARTKQRAARIANNHHAARMAALES
jgi:hypothetical protein